MPAMVDCFFFFSSRRRHTRFKCDWSSDVCSSDLPAFGQDHKPADPIGAFDDFNVEMRQNFCKRFRKLRSLISAVGEERLEEWKHPKQCRHDENSSITILYVGRMNDGMEQEA